MSLCTAFITPTSNCYLLILIFQLLCVIVYCFHYSNLKLLFINLNIPVIVCQCTAFITPTSNCYLLILIFQLFCVIVYCFHYSNLKLLFINLKIPVILCHCVLLSSLQPQIAIYWSVAPPWGPPTKAMQFSGRVYIFS